MIEQQIDIFDIEPTPDTAICITTNGYVKTDGRAVMGRGCAQTAKREFPGIDKLLGAMIKVRGNHVCHLWHFDGKFGHPNIIAFPVKHNWWEKADIKLIQRSGNELVELMIDKGFKTVYLPRPGCGNGQLEWTEVKAALGDFGPSVIVTHI